MNIPDLTDLRAGPVADFAAARLAHRLGGSACLILAVGCVICGVIGACLPLIPTTPFLLLASFLLGRSRPQWKARLYCFPVFGQCLREWQTHRGLRPVAKRRAIVATLLVMSAGGVLAGVNSAAMWTIAAGGMFGVLLIVRLPVAAEQDGCCGMDKCVEHVPSGVDTTVVNPQHRDAGASTDLPGSLRRRGDK